MLATDAWTIVRCSASMKKAAYKVHICNPGTVEAEAEDSGPWWPVSLVKMRLPGSVRNSVSKTNQEKNTNHFDFWPLLSHAHTFIHIPHHTTPHYNTIQHNKVTLHQAIIFAPHGGSMTEAKLYWHCWRKQKCLERPAHTYGDIHSYILFVSEILPSIPCWLLIRISIQKDQQK